MMNETNLIILSDCVNADLKSIENNYFIDINRKILMLPKNRQETILEFLNLEVVDKMILEENSIKGKIVSTSDSKIIKIS